MCMINNIKPHCGVSQGMVFSLGIQKKQIYVSCKRLH
jgi:hypothetical protein